MMSPVTHLEPAGARGAAFPAASGDFNPDDDYLAALDRPFGPHRIDLVIGPLALRLRGLSRAQSIALRDRYGPFRRQPGGGDDQKPDLVIDLRRAGVPHFLVLPAGEAEVYRMGRRVTGSDLTLWSYEFAGRLDRAGHAAVLGLVAAEGQLFDRGVENFLRVLTSSFVLERGGLLVHAAGIVRDGRAFVFFGPSGSGKTTVTRLSPGDTILSDDLTLILPTSHGFCAAGIPFGMAHHTAPQTSAAFPIASLNRLVQSREVYAEPISGARALAELGSSLPFVMQEPLQASLALETARRVLDAVPARRLHFRRDGGFWNIIEELC